MSLAAQNIIDRTRRTLHDDNSSVYRWSDAILVNYINDALYDMYHRRPEFWLDNTTLKLNTFIEAVDTDLSIDLLIPSRSLQGVTGYVVYRALSEDDADTENLNRSVIYRNQYEELMR